MIKVPIVVIHDSSEKMGVTNEWGNLYQVDQDSILGDGVCDALHESLESDTLKGKFELHFNKINHRLESEGLDLLHKSTESADRLKRFCSEYFRGTLGIKIPITFEVVYFDSLPDAEQNELSKAVTY